MTKSALSYAWSVVAIGFAILASAAWNWQSTNATAFGACLALAVFSSTRKFSLPRISGTLSPGFVFVLVAIATLGWTEAVVVAVVAGLVQSLWRPKNKPSPLQIAFAGGTMAVAGGLACGVTRGLVIAQGPDAMVLFLAVAALVLLVTNTLVVSTIVCLLQEAPFYTAWRAIQLRAVPYYLAGGILANIWARADLTARFGIPCLAAVSVYLLSLCFEQFAPVPVPVIGEQPVR